MRGKQLSDRELESALLELPEMKQASEAFMTKLMNFHQKNQMILLLRVVPLIQINHLILAIDNHMIQINREVAVVRLAAVVVFPA